MPTSTTLGYDDLPDLLTRLDGDEKHDWAALSTLDVVWVLYDRVLNVSPETADDPDRDRFVLSKGHGPAAYYAVLAAKGFIAPDDARDVRRLRLAARQPPGPHADPRRGDLQRLARPRAADRRRPRARAPRRPARRLPRRRRRARRGQQLGGRAVRGPDRPRAADRRRDRQPLRHLRLARRDRRALRARGLGRARPSTGATTRRSSGRSRRPASGPLVVVAEVAR